MYVVLKSIAIGFLLKVGCRVPLVKTVMPGVSPALEGKAPPEPSLRVRLTRRFALQKMFVVQA